MRLDKMHKYFLKLVLCLVITLSGCIENKHTEWNNASQKDIDAKKALLNEKILINRQLREYKSKLELDQAKLNTQILNETADITKFQSYNLKPNDESPDIKNTTPQIKNGLYIQDYNAIATSSYFNEQFKVIVESITLTSNKTIVKLLLKNDASIKTKLLVSSGDKRNSPYGFNYAAEDSNFKLPFIRDEVGNEYVSITPTIRGDAETLIFNDNGWGGNATIKVALPANSSVSTFIEFPRIYGGSMYTTLILPNINGWQSNIVINNLQIWSPTITEEESFTAKTHKPIYSEDTTLRYASELKQTNPSEQIITLNESGIAEDIDSQGKPVNIGNVFYANERYGNSRRVDVVYFAEYEGAIPERTLFSVKLFLNGNDSSLLFQCPSSIANKRKGFFSCKTTGYYLPAGSWEVRLFADDKEINRTNFEIRERAR